MYIVKAASCQFPHIICLAMIIWANQLICTVQADILFHTGNPFLEIALGWQHVWGARAVTDSDILEMSQFHIQLVSTWEGVIEERGPQLQTMPDWHRQPKSGGREGEGRLASGITTPPAKYIITCRLLFTTLLNHYDINLFASLTPSHCPVPWDTRSSSQLSVQWKPWSHPHGYHISI